jgi:UDP-N-acetyl-D-mannosaminuronic acid transferase (WecB/TagA/CpsF family)
LGRVNVLGVGVHAIDIPDAVGIIESPVREGRRDMFVSPACTAMMEAQGDPEFRDILNRALLVNPRWHANSLVWTHAREPP